MKFPSPFYRLNPMIHTMALYCDPEIRKYKNNFACFNFGEELNNMDYDIKWAMEHIFNSRLTDEQWTISSLSVHNGGIGIRKITDVALPAFLSSVHSVTDLVNMLLPKISDESVISNYTETLSRWTSLNGELTPANMKSQKEWDTFTINRIVGSLVLATDQDKARYNASLVKESNGWLTVLPSKFVGTLLDNNTFRISIALRLGCDICIPHKCKCGKNVDKSGTHGLSCKYSAGRHPRHSGFNNIICRTLHTANFPAKLEPPLFRKDGKRADGVTLIPWSNGKMLVWDATIRDTLAPSYVHSSSLGPGRVAMRAAAAKCNDYKNLIDDNYIFLPFACETLGPWCAEALQFVKQLGKMVNMATGEPKSELYFKQRISIELQRTNAASVMGTFDTSAKLDEIFYILSTNM